MSRQDLAAYLSAVLARRRRIEADVRDRYYSQPFGTNFAKVRSSPTGPEIVVAAERTYRPGAIVPTASHTGTQGEIIVAPPIIGRKGALPAIGKSIQQPPPIVCPPIPTPTGHTYTGVYWDETGPVGTGTLYAFLYNDGAYQSQLGSIAKTGMGANAEDRLHWGPDGDGLKVGWEKFNEAAIWDFSTETTKSFSGSAYQSAWRFDASASRWYGFGSTTLAGPAHRLSRRSLDAAHSDPIIETWGDSPTYSAAQYTFQSFSNAYNLLPTQGKIFMVGEKLANNATALMRHSGTKTDTFEIIDEAPFFLARTSTTTRRGVSLANGKGARMLTIGGNWTVSIYGPDETSAEIRHYPVRWDGILDSGSRLVVNPARTEIICYRPSNGALYRTVAALGQLDETCGQPMPITVEDAPPVSAKPQWMFPRD